MSGLMARMKGKKSVGWFMCRHFLLKLLDSISFDHRGSKSARGFGTPGVHIS